MHIYLLPCNIYSYHRHVKPISISQAENVKAIEVANELHATLWKNCKLANLTFLSVDPSTVYFVGKHLNFLNQYLTLP